MDCKLTIRTRSDSTDRTWSAAWPSSGNIDLDFDSPIVRESIDALTQRYWCVLGVTDGDQINILTRKVRARLVPRMQDISPEDLPERALREAQEIINEWLAEILALERCSDQLPAARTVLLSGALTDWPAALLTSTVPSSEQAEQLREALVEPIPSLAPLPMPVQSIELRRSLWGLILYHIPFRLSRMVFSQLRTLFGYRL